MDNIQNIPDYAALTPYKIFGVVELVMEKENIEFAEAVSYVYLSKLYENLSNEQTKLWHLSPHKLFDLLEEEKLTKKFQFPDFV